MYADNNIFSFVFWIRDFIGPNDFWGSCLYGTAGWIVSINVSITICSYLDVQMRLMFIKIQTGFSSKTTVYSSSETASSDSFESVKIIFYSFFVPWNPKRGSQEITKNVVISDFSVHSKLFLQNVLARFAKKLLINKFCTKLSSDNACGSSTRVGFMIVWNCIYHWIFRL